MQKRGLITIFLVVFIDLVGFGIIIPILPYYAKAFGANATILGLLMMCYSGMQFLFAPFWGKLSDHYGRRPILLTTIAGITFSLFLLAWGPTLAWLFISRILGGFFGANISTASAYIADITSPEKRAKGMGMVGAAFGLGFLFGPVIGGFLSQWGYGTAAFGAGILGIANLIFALVSLQEPPLSEEIRAEHRTHLNKTTWKKVLTTPQTGVAILLFFLMTLGMAQLETAFALFLLERFKLGARHAGYILASMAVIMVLIQGGAIGKLVKKFGETKLIWIGASIQALTLFFASYAFHLNNFIILLLIFAVGHGIVHPSMLSLVSRSSQKKNQGFAMGVYQSAGSLARMIGPIFAGLLFDHLGIQVPFLVAALFFGSAFFISFIRRQVWVILETSDL